MLSFEHGSHLFDQIGWLLHHCLWQRLWVKNIWRIRQGDARSAYVNPATKRFGRIEIHEICRWRFISPTFAHQPYHIKHRLWYSHFNWVECTSKWRSFWMKAIALVMELDNTINIMIYSIMEFHHETILSFQKLRFEFPRCEVGILHPHIRLQPTRITHPRSELNQTWKPLHGWMIMDDWMILQPFFCLPRGFRREAASGAPAGGGKVAAGRLAPARATVNAEQVWRSVGVGWKKGMAGIRAL